jgi:hypothetical protein
VFLNFDFSGDGVDLIVDGEKVNDRYYNGYPFEVGLAHHNFPKTLTLRVFALKKDDFVYIESEPKYDENGVAMTLDGVKIASSITHELKF